MARLLRASRTSLRVSSSSGSLQFQSPSFSLLSRTSISTTTTSDLSEQTLPRSPLDANIVRILRNKTEHIWKFLSPFELPTEYESFSVEDRPGKKRITMRRKFGDGEDIEIEATMFEGYTFTPMIYEYSIGDCYAWPHLSLTVGISKGDGSGGLEFKCTSWRNRLLVNSVCRRQPGAKLDKPYNGRDIRKLKGGLQKGFREYLEARGIDLELCVFLNLFVQNKDKVELLQWLRKVESYVRE